MKQNGDEYVDNFPILISEGEEGTEFRYSYDDEKAEWLANQGDSLQDFTAEEAFNALRNHL